MPTNFDITSIGRLAGELQAPVRQIENIAKRLGIQPAGRINGVPHYDVKDTERIADLLRTTNPKTTV